MKRWFLAAMLLLPVACKGLGDECDADCQSGHCTVQGKDSDPCPICTGSKSDGMFCSAKCGSDSDCEDASLAMKCVVACPGMPSFAGLCWRAEDANYLLIDLCVP